MKTTSTSLHFGLFFVMNISSPDIEPLRTIDVGNQYEKINRLFISGPIKRREGNDRTNAGTLEVDDITLPTGRYIPNSI